MTVKAKVSSPLLRPGSDRTLILASLLGNVGLGLYEAGSAVYFVRSVGLSQTQVGVGLSVAALAGLGTGLPIGHLADRIGPKKVAVAMAAAKAVPLILAMWLGSFWLFVIIVTVLGTAEAGFVVAVDAVIAGVMTGSSRVRISAYVRSVSNIGLGAGSLIAGLALAVDTRMAYQGLILSYVATSVLSALIYLRLPHIPGSAPAASSTRALRAVRDLPYLVIAQVMSLSLLGDVVLTIGLPLWIVSFTKAPAAFAAWIATINTVLVAVLQVRMARVAETLHGAVASQRWALAALAVMCVTAGAAGYLPTWSAAGLLVFSAVALTVGEMLGQSARWTLRFSLAPSDAQGQYGAAFRLGRVIPIAVGPTLVTLLTSHLRFGGWLVLSAIFLAGIAVSRPLILWAWRTRSAEVST